MHVAEDMEDSYLGERLLELIFSGWYHVHLRLNQILLRSQVPTQFVLLFGSF